MSEPYKCTVCNTEINVKRYNVEFENLPKDDNIIGFVCFCDKCLIEMLKGNI